MHNEIAFLKTVLIFKIGPEMTKLDLIWYIKIFTTKRIAVLTHVICAKALPNITNDYILE